MARYEENDASNFYNLRRWTRKELEDKINQKSVSNGLTEKQLKTLLKAGDAVCRIDRDGKPVGTGFHYVRGWVLTSIKLLTESGTHPKTSDISFTFRELKCDQKNRTVIFSSLPVSLSSKYPFNGTDIALINVDELAEKRAPFFLHPPAKLPNVNQRVFLIHFGNTIRQNQEHDIAYRYEEWFDGQQQFSMDDNVICCVMESPSTLAVSAECAGKSRPMGENHNGVKSAKDDGTTNTNIPACSSHQDRPSIVIYPEPNDKGDSVNIVSHQNGLDAQCMRRSPTQCKISYSDEEQKTVVHSESECSGRPLIVEALRKDDVGRFVGANGNMTIISSPSSSSNRSPRISIEPGHKVVVHSAHSRPGCSGAPLLYFDGENLVLEGIHYAEQPLPDTMKNVIDSPGYALYIPPERWLHGVLAIGHNGRCDEFDGQLNDGWSMSCATDTLGGT